MAKRVLLIIASVTAALGVAAPWVSGGYAQASYEQALLELKRQGIQVLESRYRRGWLVSEADADLLLAVGGQPGDGSDWRLRTSTQIAHGPLTWVDLSHGHIHPMAVRANTRLDLVTASGEPQSLRLRIDTHARLDGSTQVQVLPVAGSPLRLDGVDVRVENIQGEVHIDSQRDRIQVDVRLPLLLWSENGVPRLRVTDLEVIADTATDETGLRLGRVNLAAGDVQFSNPDPLVGVLRVLGLDLEIESEADGDFVWAVATYRCEELWAGKERLAASEIKIRADSLSAPVLVRLDRSLNDLVHADAPGRYQSFAPFAVLGANLNRLLQGGPVVTVERLFLTTEDGILDGKLRLGVDGWQAAYILNPDRWLEVLDGAAELAIPEMLLRRIVAAGIRRRLDHGSNSNPSPTESMESEIAAEAQVRIDRLLRQEFAVREGERIVTRARLSNGLLTVNGKTVPLPIDTAL